MDAEPRPSNASHASSSSSSGLLEGGAVEQLLIEDIETIAQQFEEEFRSCVSKVTKPNVLVAGVTGCGKSSLINAVFGRRLAEVGDGVSVTKHFQRFAPEGLPVVVYDSKGLEDGQHESFVRDTKLFFQSLRDGSPGVEGHVHVIWYVVNAAWARFEPYEAKLIREVFAPVPVLFLLNKADVASRQQLDSLQVVIEGYRFTNNKGLHRVVADRKNFSQSWCPLCGLDDVSFQKTTQQLFCDDCDAVSVLTMRMGLAGFVEQTARLLPDLAKEAFLFAQQASMAQKDIRAKEIVKSCSNRINIDVSGRALSRVGDMVGRIFVLWGWNYLGERVSDALVDQMLTEYKSQELSSRLAMVAADTIYRRKLSRSVIACLGVMVNRPLRSLSKQLLATVEPEDDANRQPGADEQGSSNGAATTSSLRVLAGTLFSRDVAAQQAFPDQFMKLAFDTDIDAAIEAYWT